MTFLGKFKGGYQDIWKSIIRPPRDEYSIGELGKFCLDSLFKSSRSQRICPKGKTLQKNRSPNQEQKRPHSRVFPLRASQESSKGTSMRDLSTWKLFF